MVERGPHAALIERLVAALEQTGYRLNVLQPRVPELAGVLAAACPDSTAARAMIDEIDWWVRRQRLAGLWLSFLFQFTMQQQGSLFFIVACRLYAEAQIGFNEDLALSSLENGYNGALSYAELTDPGALDGVVADLRGRMRQIYGYYRRWYGSPNYSSVNPLTEHLYSELTWERLVMQFPAVRDTWTSLAVDGLAQAAETAAAVGDAYAATVARRFLGIVYDARNDLPSAQTQFTLALESAHSGAIDTEIGHLYRLSGHAFSRSGDLEQATKRLEAALAHEAHPRCVYWRSLSARELGDVWMRRAPQEIDPKQPPPEIDFARRAYGSGLGDFEVHVAAGVIPVARGIAQQMFRSFTDNAVQAAMLSNPLDTLAEIEALGPRSATDTFVEGRAALAGPPEAYAAYRRGRAIFWQDFFVFDLERDAEADFASYLTSVRDNRADRQSYIRTRNELTGPIASAQFSRQNVERLLTLRLPNTMFLNFHLGAQQLFCCLIDSQSGQAATAIARIDAGEWQHVHETYHAAVEAARHPPPAPALTMTGALDTLIAYYCTELGGLFDGLLPVLKGKRVKIFPRSWMHEVPLHAIPVADGRLGDHCIVSYAPTIGLFLGLRDEAARAPGAPVVVHDSAGTPYYGGTLRMLEAAGLPVQRIADATWDRVSADLATLKPSDIVFACHGKYDPDDPRRSALKLTAQNVVPLSQLLSDLDLRGLRSVTMGACESGLGRTLLAAEYIGLPLAFLAAGARYVVGSLWEVNQIASAILMTEYLTLLRAPETAVPSALVQAQRHTMGLSQDAVMDWLRAAMPERAVALESGIRALGDRPYEHPYYWAGFYATGDV